MSPNRFCDWHLGAKGYAQELAVFERWVEDAEQEYQRRKGRLLCYKKAARVRAKGADRG
jgi:hypothetical protein